MTTENAIWDMSDNVEDFPSGVWDDFDGAIEVARYEKGEYGAQLFVMIMPEPYEFEARELEIPLEGQEFEGQPRLWWGMGGGGDTYNLSEDGMDILKGPRPNKNTAFVKGTTRLLKVLGRTTMAKNLTPLNEGDPIVVHWKREPEKYRYRDALTGDRKEGEREVMYPVGKRLGTAKLAAGTGAAAEGETTNRRGRRAARASGGGEAAESPTQAPLASGASRRSGGARRRSSQSDTPAEDAGDEGPTPEDGADSSSPTGDSPGSKSNEILGEIVGAFGDEGVIRRTIGRVAREYIAEHGADAIKAAVTKDSIDAAIEAGVLTQEDNRLYVPEDTE